MRQGAEGAWPLASTLLVRLVVVAVAAVADVVGCCWLRLLFAFVQRRLLHFLM